MSSSTAWTIEARRDLHHIRQEVNQLLQKLVLQETTREEIQRVQRLCDDFREKHSSNFQQYFDQRELLELVLSTQEDMIKKLTSLQILDLEMTKALQTYPYSRPENVQDEFAPIVTTESRNVQNITTTHLYPSSKLSTPPVAPSTILSDTSSSTSFDGTPPTISLYNLLYISRVFQTLRNAPSHNPHQNIPFNQQTNAAVGKMFWSMSYQDSPQSLLNKTPNEIVQMIYSGQIQ